MEQNQTQSEIGKLVKELTERPIAVQPIYKKLTGSWSAAILISQIMYWSKKVDRAFYKTDEEFAEELYMTQKEFRTAKEHLSSVPFIRFFRAGQHGQTHYEVNYDLFVSTMKQCIESLTRPNGRIAQKGETQPAQMGETEAVLTCPNGRILYTETTKTETTTENTFGENAKNSSTPKTEVEKLEAKRTRREYSRDFSDFWGMYGVGSKSNAYSAWQKQNPTQEEQELIKSCIPEYKAYCISAERSFKDGQGWINGRFWENKWTHEAQGTIPRKNKRSVEPMKEMTDEDCTI